MDEFVPIETAPSVAAASETQEPVAAAQESVAAAQESVVTTQESVVRTASRCAAFTSNAYTMNEFDLHHHASQDHHRR